MKRIDDMIQACPGCRRAWEDWMAFSTRLHSIEIVRGKVKGGHEFHLSLCKSQEVGQESGQGIIIAHRGVGLKEKD